MDWFTMPYIGFAGLILLGGYLLGCVQSAYIVGRVVYKIDIREHGSGGAGMTNTARVMGGRAALIVFLADVLKCVAAYAIASVIFDGSGTFFTSSYGANYFPGVVAALGVVLGHCFPFFLKFRGGKGAASSVGLVIMLSWQVSLIVLAIGIAIIFITKYISAASLIGFAAMIPTVALLGYGKDTVIIVAIIALIGWYTHRSNIVRLLSGKESRFSVKKRK